MRLTMLAQALDQSLLDRPALILLLALLSVLALFAVLGQFLRRQTSVQLDPAIIRTFNNRVVSWMTICAILSGTLMFERWVTVVFFGLISFWALREFITMTPTRRGDHRTLTWVFFLFTPLQYVMVSWNLLRLYTIVIPVYASLFIPARIAFTGDVKRFLERTAKIQFGLLICVYALSHAPALLYLELQRFDLVSGQYVEWNGKPAGLLLFLLVMVQISDTIHFVCDRTFGRYIIAAHVNATRSWEGLMLAGFGTGLVAMIIQFLLPVTPFTWYGAGIMAMVISIMASSGTMTLSAIKRDRGVKDYGTLVQGHAGVLDRIDSVCFAAPIFFHMTKYFLGKPDTLAAAGDWFPMFYC